MKSFHLWRLVRRTRFQSQWRSRPRRGKHQEQTPHLPARRASRLSQGPPAAKFINASGIPHNTIHANNPNSEEIEPDRAGRTDQIRSDPVSLGLFASVSIEKGKPFAPR